MGACSIQQPRAAEAHPGSERNPQVSEQSNASMAAKLFPEMAKADGAKQEQQVGKSTVNTSYGDLDYRYVQAMQQPTQPASPAPQQPASTEQQPGQQLNFKPEAVANELSPEFFTEAVQKA